MEQPPLRLASSNGQREPGWRLTPDRRLRLVVSQAQPLDALDLEWASAEQQYPHWKDSIAELKALIRQLTLAGPPTDPFSETTIPHRLPAAGHQ